MQQLTYDVKYVTQYFGIVLECQRHEYLTVLNENLHEPSAGIDSPVPVRLRGLQFFSEIQQSGNTFRA